MPKWTVAGCLSCEFSSYTPSPRERCPNDGTPLVWLPPLGSSWRKLEALRAKRRPDPVLVAVADGVREIVRAALGIGP